MKAKLNRASLHRLTPLLLMFATLSVEMSTDIYLPSLPEMGRFFMVPDGTVQMTLSAYLLGFSLLGLIAGPLSDSIGRRPVILGSMATFTISSIWCWVTSTMTGLIMARFTQGIGAGMAMVVSTAILKDIYNEKNFSRILSTMGMIIALSPMVAPILGGKIADVWGWKSCFFLIALIAIIIWISKAICLEESLSLEDRRTQKSFFSGALLLDTYGQLLKQRKVITFSLISAITYGGLWAWIVEAPFYFINELGIKSAHYGYYAAIGPGAYILGTILNRRCVAFYGVEQMLSCGLWLMVTGAILTLLVTLYWPFSLVGLYISFSFYAVGLAPVFANAATKAVSVIPSLRGGASALLNTFEMGMSSLCTFIVSLFSNKTLVPCAVMMLSCSLLCAVLFFLISALDKRLQMTSQHET